MTEETKPEISPEGITHPPPLPPRESRLRYCRGALEGALLGSAWFMVFLTYCYCIPKLLKLGGSSLEYQDWPPLTQFIMGLSGLTLNLILLPILLYFAPLVLFVVRLACAATPRTRKIAEIVTPILLALFAFGMFLAIVGLTVMALKWIHLNPT